MKSTKVILPDEFLCCNCGILPIIEFTEGMVLRELEKNGKSTYCKTCVKKYNEKYYIENKEKYKQWSTDYRIKNKKTVSEYHKKYRFENKEKFSQYRKNHYENNKEYYKKYRETNKEKISMNRKEYYENNKGYYEEKNKEYYKNNTLYYKENSKKWRKDNGLQLKSTRIWNGTNTEYNLNDFLNNKGIVYFIGDIHGLYVKIGITSSIFSLSHRFRTIQGCNPMPLKLLGFIQDDNAAKLERRLHEQFKIHNRIGEWFVISPDITRYIKENCMHIELANTMIGETYLSLPSILADDMGY